MSTALATGATRGIGAAVALDVVSHAAAHVGSSRDGRPVPW